MRRTTFFHGKDRSAVVGEAPVSAAPSGADLVIEDLDEFAAGTSGRFCALTNADYIFSASAVTARH